MAAKSSADPWPTREQKVARVNNKPALLPQNAQPEPGSETGAEAESRSEPVSGDLPAADPAAADWARSEPVSDAEDAEDMVPGGPRLRKPDGSPRGPRAAAALAERKTKRAADLEIKRGDPLATHRSPRQGEAGGNLALVPGAGQQRGNKAAAAGSALSDLAPAAADDALAEVLPPLSAQAPAPLPAATPRPAERRHADPDDVEGPAPEDRRKTPRRKAVAGAERSGPVAEPAGAAVVRRRHYGVLLSSFIFIWIPLALAGWYLWTHAVDQFESTVGFAVRTEEAASPYDLLGALGGGTGSANDMDVLNEFIRSQQLVEKLDAELDLRHKFGLPDGDPLMSLPDQVTVEDLVDFWRRMVIINYDSSTGLMDLQVFAFTPEDAQIIATAVLKESGLLVNQMSAIARDDTTRFTKEALEIARQRMSDARAAITEFRIRNQIVDPTADIAAQMSVLATLNQQLASAQVELDTLIIGNVASGDPRVQTANRRIAAIEGRIKLERTKLGVGEDGDMSGFATLFGDYERLKVDVTFAEGTYLAALSAYDGAETEAQRKSRYLAAFVEPTLAEASTAPNRPLLLALVFAIGFFTWSILVLIYYALRDRR